MAVRLRGVVGRVMPEAEFMNDKRYPVRLENPSRHFGLGNGRLTLVAILATVLALVVATYYVAPASADTANAGNASATAGADAASALDVCVGGSIGGHADTNFVVPVSGTVCSLSDLFGLHSVQATTPLSNGITSPLAFSTGTCNQCLAGAFTSAVQSDFGIAASNALSFADFCKTCGTSAVASAAADDPGSVAGSTALAIADFCQRCETAAGSAVAADSGSSAYGIADSLSTVCPRYCSAEAQTVVGATLDSDATAYTHAVTTDVWQPVTPTPTPTCLQPASPVHSATTTLRLRRSASLALLPLTST